MYVSVMVVGGETDTEVTVVGGSVRVETVLEIVVVGGS